MKRLLSVAAFTFCVGVCGVSAQTTTTTTKQGMSQPAKGAVIGGVAGAATGLIVGHGRAKSAVIGGAVGAGAGYLYGKHRQRTHPRRVTKRIVKVD